MKSNLKLTDFPIRAGHFATQMRAISFAEFLEKGGVKAMVRSPRWANKRLLPSRTEVLVQAADEAAADALFIQFTTGGAR